jgi:hypothetical protein
MIRRVSILTFLLLLGANSISGVSAQPESEGGCTMACCKAALQGGSGSALPKLYCKLECKEPASTNGSSGASVTSGAARSESPASHNNKVIPDPAFYLTQVRFPHSPTRHLAGCSSRFLETGSLLI